MHGPETKTQLNIGASHQLSKCYIPQAKCSVKVKAQSLGREHHKLMFIRK